MKPVSLMRLRPLDKPTDVLKFYKPEELLIEEKYDGFKVLATKDLKGRVKLYTRRGISFEENVPGVVREISANIPLGTTVLGELIYLSHGKQSLAHVQSIVNASSAHALKQNQKGLKFIVYDVLEYKSKDVTKLPLVERRKILKSLNLTVPPAYKFSKYKTIISKALKVGGEGIVVKPLNSKYVYRSLSESEPFGEWYKFKPFDNEDVMIDSYFYRGKEKKAIFPAYQRKRGKLVEVGKLSGMDRKTEEGLRKRIDDGEKLVVEVTFQEKYPSGKIRAVSFVRDRTKEKVV